ncbi:MAG: M28 family peptidase [Clostridia bacterium]|nr:M28 family peptidase [Clostridia bacterium]
MTESTKIIFEKYEIRKTKRQKTAFIDHVTGFADSLGYEAHVEKGEFGARNIIVGDPASAKAVFTAHYDTCPRLPFPNLITPRNIFLYILYQIVITIAIFAVPIIIGVLLYTLLTSLGVNEEIADLISDKIIAPLILIECLLIMFGPANKHTANDNTSGVTLLLDIMTDLPIEDRGAVAFIFFDLEEVGLIGSSSYGGKHKADMKTKLVINFDCVSDGKTFLFALNKKAEAKRSLLESAYAPEGEYECEFHSKGVIYPSDQMSFPLGVGVSALLRTKKGLLYMNKIHTPKDTVYDEANVLFLKERSIKLAKMLSEEEPAKAE